MGERHHCQNTKTDSDKHITKYAYRFYGTAVETCEEDEDGHFWVDNDEYSNQANFCPFCGAKAPQPAEREEL